MQVIRPKQNFGSPFAAIGSLVLMQIVLWPAVYNSLILFPEHELSTSDKYIVLIGELLKEDPNEIILDFRSRTSLIALLIPSLFFVTAIWVQLISFFVPMTRIGSLLRLLTMSLVFQSVYLVQTLITTIEFNRLTSVVAFGFVPIVAESIYILCTNGLQLMKGDRLQGGAGCGASPVEIEKDNKCSR